jgi:manganese transport protein
MAGGSIFAGIFKEPYNISDIHTKIGVLITFIPALILIFFITNPFNALIISQMMLSIQLPVTIFLQVYLTSSEQVMGKYRNSICNRIVLITVGLIVTGLNIMLLGSFIF